MPPTIRKHVRALERSGRLLAGSRVHSAVSAKRTPILSCRGKDRLAPQLAAHQDAIRLNKKLFERVAAIYRRRASLKLDPESLRLVEREYDQFVSLRRETFRSRQGQLKKLNQEASSLSDAFSQKLLDATKAGAYVTADKTALAGLGDAQLAAAAQAANTATPRATWSRCKTPRNNRARILEQPRHPRNHIRQFLETALSAVTQTIRGRSSRAWRS